MCSKHRAPIASKDSQRSYPRNISTITFHIPRYHNAPSKTGLRSTTANTLDRARIRIYVYAYMRTTLVLEDQLFKTAKRTAGEEGTTLSEVVNRALRRHLLAKPDTENKSAAFSMPVFGDPTRARHQTPQQLAELRDDGR